MKNISLIADEVIDGLLVELRLTGRHIIRGSTVRERIRNCILLEYGNQDTKDLIEMGITQLAQQRLYAHNFRSASSKRKNEDKHLKGYFANFKECNNPYILVHMIKNQELSVSEKQTVLENLKAQNKEILYGQGFMVFDGNEFVKFDSTMTEEEYIEMLEKDAI